MTTALSLPARITDGKLPARIFQELTRLAERFDGKTLVIEVREQKRIISDKQRRFYRGPFIQDIQRRLLEHGHRVSAEDIHAGLREAYAKNGYTITLENGAVFRVPPSTTRFSTSQTEDYLTEIRADFAQRFGWELPFPNEHLYPLTEAKEGK